MQANPLAVRCVNFCPARVEQVDACPSVLHGFVGIGKCGRSFEYAFAALDGLNHCVNRAGTRFGAFHGLSHWFGFNLASVSSSQNDKRHVGVETAPYRKRPNGFRYMTVGTHMPRICVARCARLVNLILPIRLSVATLTSGCFKSLR